MQRLLLILLLSLISLVGCSKNPAINAEEDAVKITEYETCLDATSLSGLYAEKFCESKKVSTYESCLNIPPEKWTSRLLERCSEYRKPSSK